jgi:hypothetical protein
VSSRQDQSGIRIPWEESCLVIDREIFLDRTHGGRFVTLLRELGFAVNPIKEVYPNGKDQFIPDPDWIRLCGEKNCQERNLRVQTSISLDVTC